MQTKTRGRRKGKKNQELRKPQFWGRTKEGGWEKKKQEMKQ